MVDEGAVCCVGSIPVYIYTCADVFQCTYFKVHTVSVRQKS